MVQSSLLTTSHDGKSTTFKNVERFDVTGSAIRVGGKWLLASITKTYTPRPHSDLEVERAANSQFTQALQGLLTERARREDDAKFARIDSEMVTSMRGLGLMLILSRPDMVSAAQGEPPAKDFPEDGLGPLKPNPGQNRYIIKTTKFEKAPSWVKPWVEALQMVPAEPRFIPMRLTRHPYRNKTVYRMNLPTAGMWMIYDENGKHLCTGPSKYLSDDCPRLSGTKGILLWQRSGSAKQVVR